MFAIMSELKFFLLTRVFTQNFNTEDLVKFLEKNKKLHIQTVVVTLKLISYKTMSKKKVNKSKNPRFYGQKIIALGQFQPHGCM